MKERFDNPTLYNEKVRRAWIPYWTKYAFENYATIKKLYEERGDLDLLGSTNEMEGKPTIIVGSGPSLDDIIGRLKEWKGYIICSTSQLSTLQYHGVEPDFCFLIDSDPSQIFLLDGYKSDKTVFVTHPSVPPAYFEAWKGKFKFFRMNEPGPNGFFSESLPAAYTELTKEGHGIRTHVMNAGCVPNTIIPFVTVRACRPIFMAGVDFGYPGDQYRFTKAVKENGEWKVIPDTGIPPDIPIQIAENGVKTDKVCIFYKYAFVLLWGLSGSPILSCSRGINYHLPYVHPDEVIDKQGQGFEHLIPSQEQAYLTAQNYLEKRGTFITKQGFQINTFTKFSVKGLQKLRNYAFYYYWRGRTDWQKQLNNHMRTEKVKMQKLVDQFKKWGIPQDKWEPLINLPKEQREYMIESIREDTHYARLAQGKDGGDNGGDGDLRTGSSTILDGSSASTEGGIGKS